MKEIIAKLLNDDIVGVKDSLKDKMSDEFTIHVKEIQSEVGKTLFDSKDK